MNHIENFWDLLQQHVTTTGTQNISDRQITTRACRWCREVTVTQCCAAQVSMLGQMNEIDDSRGWSIAH